MVYTRLYVLVVAFYNWANEEHRTTPGCMCVEDLYKAIVALMYKNHRGEITNISTIASLHEYCKVACYAPSPWCNWEQKEKFRGEVEQHINSAILDLSANKYHAWTLVHSTYWFQLFRDNFLIDDEKACKLS